MPPRARATAGIAKPAGLDKRLVLNGWMLSLFGEPDNQALLGRIGDRELEGFDTDGVSKYFRQLSLVLDVLKRPELPNDVLLSYDENIVRHWREITSPPERQGLTLKQFQYLALLFAEIYLDRYFDDRNALLASLNQFVQTWNFGKPPGEQANPFAAVDLNKLAFWMATGAGKTLLMHINIRQYQHYLAKAGRTPELNRIILLTPNEGLSLQHLEELQKSGIAADLFSKEGRSLWSGQAVEIIDIHKLAEDSKEKTVAVEAFEGNNLVLVDEGHRGSSTEVGVWMDRRRRLSADGFSFEYSATFGQAIKPSSKDLTQEYGHCILFDYSYRYFYNDGYGKDFHILNLQADQDDGQRQLYLTGGLLSFLQQLHVFREIGDTIKPYGVEKPLWIFVGSSVTKTTSARDISDIGEILQFFDAFLKDRDAAVARIELIRTGKHGLLSGDRDIFHNRLQRLFVGATGGRTADQVYDDALSLIFNAPQGGALHVAQLKGKDADGEIELRVGDHEAFGVVNVGDASKVVTQAGERGVTTGDPLEFKGSLFQGINKAESTVNVLVGAKKFSEGWSSWRVSTMGLMNVGKSEGSQIIQLFGRGVRLKGLGFSLKRSGALPRDDGEKHPELLPLLETLNIIGVKADYMQTFKEFLEEEGLVTDDDLEEMTVRVLNRLEPGGAFAGVQLLTIGLQPGRDFKKQGPKPNLADAPPEPILKRPVSVDWYPRIQSRASKGAAVAGGDGTKFSGTLIGERLAYLDYDAIWFELERFKAEKAYYNLAIPREAPKELLEQPSWYELFVPEDELVFSAFAKVRLWQEIAVALLKRYVERFYLFRKAEWESQFLQYRELGADDGNFFTEYTFMVPRDPANALRMEVEGLSQDMVNGTLKDRVANGLTAVQFDRSLYVPLVQLAGTEATVRPKDSTLNDGERAFVKALRDYLLTNAKEFEGKAIYLLRNRSRARGLGFFEAGNFYPDFILWVVDGGVHHLAFVDPKGLRQLTAGQNDPKIRFAEDIKSIEKQLGRAEVKLDSFIWSQTAYQQLGWQDGSNKLTEDDLAKAHVLFPGAAPGASVRRLFALMAV